jgi:hypothetical protein
MACWVAPAVAAELWGIPVSQILQAIASGRIASREEHGFTFVSSDLLPQAASEKSRLKPEDRPPTFAQRETDIAPAPILRDHDSVQSDDENDVAEPETIVLEDWRKIRSQTQRLRRPPLAA